MSPCLSWKNEGGPGLVWRRRKMGAYQPEILTLYLGEACVGTVSKALVASQGHRWECLLPGLDRPVKGTHVDIATARAKAIEAVRVWLALANVGVLVQEQIAAV